MQSFLRLMSFFCFFVIASAESSVFKGYQHCFYQYEIHDRTVKKAGELGMAIDTAKKDREALALDLAKFRAVATEQFVQWILQDKRDELDSLFSFLSSIPEKDGFRTEVVGLLHSVIQNSSALFHSLRALPLDSRYKVLERTLEYIGKRFNNLNEMEKSTQEIPIYVAFHWHMNQPIYWPYENIDATINKKAYSFDLLDVFSKRHGPYTTWVNDAASSCGKQNECGVHVSFTGSLMENLDSLEQAGMGFYNWKESFQKNNGAYSFAGTGYYHPVLPLLEQQDSLQQILRQRQAYENVFGVKEQAGFFPPELSIAPWNIPAIKKAGYQWAFVDQIHYMRAMKDYPWTSQENLPAPNPGQQGEQKGEKWFEMSGLWSPSSLTPAGFKPFYSEYDGYRVIMVPVSRYISNEDLRGGISGEKMELLLSQLQKYNKDPKHPFLVVISHDGDNFGSGGMDYYQKNFPALVRWFHEQENYHLCTVDHYLKKYPPMEKNMTFEPGSGLMGDNGDPLFHKWLAPKDPITDYSADRNSWSAIVAARNWVLTADKKYDNNPRIKLAWDFLLASECSSYEYWDGTEIWDSHASRAVNKAVLLSQMVLGEKSEDKTPPSMLPPFHEPLNPGGQGAGQKSGHVKIWTLIYDLSGLKSVQLHYTINGVEQKPLDMLKYYTPSKSIPRALESACEYSVVLYQLANSSVKYHVVAEDMEGNVSVSRPSLVYVDKMVAPKPIWEPESPSYGDAIKIYSKKPGYLHWGVNDWNVPDDNFWPQGSIAWGDERAIESPLQGPDEKGRYFAELGPFPADSKVERIDILFHFRDNSWGENRVIPLK